MLNWRLSLPSLRRCRSDKSDRYPKEESLSNAYPGTLYGGSEQGYTDYLSRLASGLSEALRKNVCSPRAFLRPTPNQLSHHARGFSAVCDLDPKTFGFIERMVA